MIIYLYFGMIILRHYNSHLQDNISWCI